VQLEDSENELLWFRLLDCPVGFLRKIKQEVKAAAQESTSWNRATTNKPAHVAPPPAASTSLLTVTETVGSSQHQRELVQQKSLQSLTHLINTILMNMMGYVALPSILSKIVKDHAQHEFGDFKSTIVGMLDTYAYETTILKTANHLIDNDMYTATNSLVNNMKKGLFSRLIHVWHVLQTPTKYFLF